MPVSLDEISKVTMLTTVENAAPNTLIAQGSEVARAAFTKAQEDAFTVVVGIAEGDRTFEQGSAVAIAERTIALREAYKGLGYEDRMADKFAIGDIRDIEQGYKHLKVKEENVDKYTDGQRKWSTDESITKLTGRTLGTTS